MERIRLSKLPSDLHVELKLTAATEFRYYFVAPRLQSGLELILIYGGNKIIVNSSLVHRKV